MAVAAVAICAARLTFEAASIKPASVARQALPSIAKAAPWFVKAPAVPIPRNTGGPGTDDPGRIHYPLISLKSLLHQAWDSYYEIKGPAWLDTEMYAIEATMPPATTKEQFREMLRNLIAERFGLEFHAETKEAAAYNLIVSKSGLKIKESPNQNETAATGPPPRARGRTPDGFLILPPRPGPFNMSMTTPTGTRMVLQQQTMRDLAETLGKLLNATVTDATGLPAKYDFTVTYADTESDAAEPLPDIYTAVQSQLGLKLEQKKVAVEVMVIDHIEKTPAGN